TCRTAGSRITLLTGSGADNGFSGSTGTGIGVNTSQRYSHHAIIRQISRTMRMSRNFLKRDMQQTVYFFNRSMITKPGGITSNPNAGSRKKTI
ncbi:MAG: hypothetical protein KDI15_08990, partial [Thiothrix sp.]|nr:hypothetical protein [Thiothrix sp.]